MCSDWITVEEVIKTTAPVFTAGAACSGAYLAYRGLSKWRAETVGKRKVELAEEVLADFYQARDIINAARSPLVFEGEGASRAKMPTETDQETRVRNAHYVAAERLLKDAAFFAQLQARRYRFIAYFGEAASKPYDSLRAIHRKIFVAVHMLLTTYEDRNEATLPRQREQWRKESEWYGPDDQISLDLDKVVNAMESTCRPVIQVGGPSTIP
jgi:hypothetical protein